MYLGEQPAVGTFDLITLSQSFDGSRTAFTMSKSVGTANQLMIVLNGVTQHWGDAFTVSGTTLTFTSAPASGSAVKILDFGRHVLDVGTISGGSVTTAKLADDAVTLAKLASGAVGKPAFHAVLTSNQTVATATVTILAYGTEIFDTDGAYDTSTYKFTPQVAGTYLFGASTILQQADTKTLHTFIVKNGVAVANNQFSGVESFGNLDYAGQHVSGLVVMNGSSDWVACASQHNKGSDNTYAGNSTMNSYHYFWGCRIY